MQIEIPPFFYALGATLGFAYASTIFTEYARKISPFWVNSFKAFVALFAFWLTVVLTHSWISPNPQTVIALLSSGCIGLMIGDIFMLHAMKDLGPSRMLMIFGLQPFFLGLTGYYFFGQKFSVNNFIGIVFMLLCLYTISLETYKKIGHWQLRGLILGFIAILLDAAGTTMTRYGFEMTPGLGSPQANALRCVGAVLCFYLVRYTFYDNKKETDSFRHGLKKINQKEKTRLIAASLCGTFLSLMLYVLAISKGQLSVISSLSVTGPMFAEFFDCVVNKKRPTPYLLVAFVFFTSGFVIFTTGTS